MRLFDSIINYTNIKKKTGLLPFVDFEKAFDSIEWSLIENTLKYYNFGTSLVTFCKRILYRYQQLCSEQRMVFDFFKVRSWCETGMSAVPIFIYLVR